MHADKALVKCPERSKLFQYSVVEVTEQTGPLMGGLNDAHGPKKLCMAFENLVYSILSFEVMFF